MKCVACLQGQDWECQVRGNCDDGSDSELGSGNAINPGGTVGFSSLLASTVEDSEDPDPDQFRTYKDDSALRDQQSTGRKRAAKMYPLDSNAPCEWRMMKNCGGGKFPITGCAAGFQDARHHGPEKNTLNNEKGNVHRICHTCHNRWHTLNDEGYVWDGIHEPHAPESATMFDLLAAEDFWDGRKLVKAKD